MSLRNKIIIISCVLYTLVVAGEILLFNSLSDINKDITLALVIGLGIMQLVIGLVVIDILILRPLRDLIDDVKKIAKSGKFTNTMRIGKAGEVSDLARDINTIIGTLELNSKSLIEVNKELKSQRDTIEQEVDRRTHQLKEEQARLIASINSFPDAFIVTDTSGDVLLTNKALNTTLDTRIEDVTMDDLERIFDDMFDIRRNIALCQSERKSLVLSGVAFKKRFLKIYIAPIMFGGDTIIGSVILIGDITEAVLTERSKDEFLAIASHELRTPLTAIKGNSELLKQYFSDKEKDNNYKEIIDDIQKASDSLISIVNSFLTTSRLEQNRLEFDNEKIKVEPLVKEVVEKYKYLAESKKLSLSYANISSAELTVKGDKQRIEEVLTNLIGNALKYTDSGSIKVLIDRKENVAKVSVIDSGKGIPLKQQSLLFKKFQQTSNNIFTRDIAHGTGLGLYISKLMVEAMNGEIYLEESNVNRGSIFTFTIPLA